MKRINAKNIMEKGGLMIEALAMLGLIAVVTPTMYKKSAERTMEIEDINTATTIRTISDAADSFISANYSTILADMTSGNQVMRNINIDDIKPYLPYGFDVEKSLVNYSTPKIGVRRPDTTSNSLTTFVLFPAKADEEEGIGQERTSRIASLIGANGGYTREIESTPAGGGTPTTETIAKGIGGIWALNKDNLNSLFGEDDGSGNKTYSGNINSIVTASSETIDISAAAEANNDKYLQRGLSDGEEKWRTAMSSDLYMGGIPDDPIYGEKTNQMHSIRRIQSLIVGAETGVAPETEGKEYGLYIAAGEGVSSAAYIGGALKALGGEFQVKGEDANKLLGFISKTTDNSKFHFEINEASLRYGYENDTSPYNFEVTSDGNITAQGDITNYGNIELAQGGGKSISIGSIAEGGNLISGNTTDNRVDILMNGESPVTETGIDAPTYDTTSSTSPTFNVEVGSNMKVHGIMAAGQLDTNKIRASSLAVGSEKVDDAKKWMYVDKDGVRIADPKYQHMYEDGTYNLGFNRVIIRKKDEASRDNPDIEISTGNRQKIPDIVWEGTDIDIGQGVFEVGSSSSLYPGRVDDHILRMADGKIINSVSTGDGSDSDLLPKMGTVLTSEGLTIGQWIKGEDKNIIEVDKDASLYMRKEGSTSTVDMVATNLNVTNEYGQNILSIQGNSLEPEPERDIDMWGKYWYYLGSDGGIREEWGKTANHLTIRPRGVNIYSGSQVVESFGAVELEATNPKNGQAMGIGLDANNAVEIYHKDAAMGGKVGDKRKIVLDDDSINMRINNERIGVELGVELNLNGLYVRGNWEEGNYQGDKTLLTQDGYSGNGVIQVGKIVANNKNFTSPLSNIGYPYKKDETTGKMVVDYSRPYNIDNTYGTGTRYDTYMVNPAYTSVMHDIKLTTRAGARLSDILPDFINKGIYVVRNSYQDTSGTSGDTSADFLPTSDGTVVSSTIQDGTWASPYVGEIPAPQCPPGYGRVVTLAPISFEVAQSGNIGIHGERRFVKRTSPIATDTSGNKVLEPYEFVQATDSASGKVTFKNNAESASEVTYVIGTNSPNVKPFSVQQSNWLKTHVRPRTNTEGFTTSWDAFMGFIYMEKEYGDLIAYLTEENSNPRFVYQADGNEDGIPDIFWNIFPVRRNSLDAYATVYCYFDRSNGMAKEINENGLVDQHSPNQGYTSYEKQSSSGYIERLNDPTLKYDEAW